MKATLIAILLVLTVTLQALPPAHEQPASQTWGMPEPVAVRRDRHQAE